MFRKLDFDTIYYANLIEWPFKYYISILGEWGVQNLGKPAYIIPARSLDCLDLTVFLAEMDWKGCNEAGDDCTSLIFFAKLHHA